MIHPHTELRFISKEIGYGVVATEFIPAGTITWVQDKLDREFTKDQFNKLDSIYQDILETYTYTNNKGNRVLCWDNGRFVNHSFNSNCLSTAYDCELAIRDIEKGEQLTDDYGYLNINKPFRGVDEGTKRKIVYPDDLKKYYISWDKKLERVYPKILHVEQPLRVVFSKSNWHQIEKIASGKQKPSSILLNYYEK